MAYIVGEVRNQVQIVCVSLNDLIDQNNPVRVSDAYVEDQIELYLAVMEQQARTDVA